MRDRVLACYKANEDAIAAEVLGHERDCAQCAAAKAKGSRKVPCEAGWALIRLLRSARATTESYKATQREIEAQVVTLFDLPEVG